MCTFIIAFIIILPKYIQGSLDVTNNVISAFIIKEALSVSFIKPYIAALDFAASNRFTNKTTVSTSICLI
jgi:hypothetical protein